MSDLNSEFNLLDKFIIFLYKHCVVQRTMACVRNLFFLFLSSVVVSANAQMNYDDYKPEQKEILLDDQFTLAKNSWSMDKKSEIVDGFLEVSSWNTPLKRSSLLKLQLDQTRDFEIETSFSCRSLSAGDFSVALGKIFWNFSSENIPGSGFQMFKTNGLMCWLAENQAETEDYQIKRQSLLSKVSTADIREKVINKFTIRKVGKKLYYFINEFPSVSISFTAMPEAKFGFWVKSQQINVDYVTVSYLLTENQTTNQDNISPNRTPSKSNGVTPIKSEVKPGGKYFALIVGVSKYDEAKLNLDNPEKDAEKIKEVFVSRYSFADSTTFLLLNPSRQKIIAELYRLRKIIGPNDNLLIFYAGHGFWDEDARQGYWWAKDAIPDDPSTWLSNSDLREQIRSIKSAHTLLISDACFSGGIFKTRSGNEIQNATRDIQLLYAMPSRRAITSGTMTAVPDNSVFLQYFAKRLSDNQNKFLSSQQLFDSFRAAVINNSSVVPQDGVIAETGDEGGDFIFILKEK